MLRKRIMSLVFVVMLATVSFAAAIVDAAPITVQVNVELTGPRNACPIASDSKTLEKSPKVGRSGLATGKLLVYLFCIQIVSVTVQ